MNAGNVEFVRYDIVAIIKALEKACFNVEYKEQLGKLENLYGDGHAMDKIVDTLASIDLNDKKWYVERKLC